MPPLHLTALTFAIALILSSALSTWAHAAADAVDAAPPAVKEEPRVEVRPAVWELALPRTRAVTDGVGNFLYARLSDDGAPVEVVMSNRQPDNLAELAAEDAPMVLAFGGSRIGVGRSQGVQVLHFPPEGGIRMTGKPMPANATDPIAAYLKAAVGPNAATLGQWLKANGWPSWLDPKPAPKPDRAIRRDRPAKHRPDADAPPEKPQIQEADDSPLHSAVLLEKHDQIEALLADGMDINVRGRKGDTPLHRAAFFNRLETAKLLIKAGAGLDHANARGQSPLHQSVFYNRPEMVTLLLEAGADVNARDAKGSTPLHLAIQYRRLAYIEPLLKAGARLDVRDSAGQTPLDLARARGISELATRLEAEQLRRDAE